MGAKNVEYDPHQRKARVGAISSMLTWVEKRSVLERRIRSHKVEASVIANTDLTNFSLTVKMGNVRKSSDKADDVIVVFRSRRNTSGVNLSNLTLDELAAFREVIDYALRTAQPVCAERDAESQVGEGEDDDFVESIEEGMDFDWRHYRRVPEVLIANGENEADSTSLRVGPAWTQGLGKFIQRKLHVSRSRGAALARREPVRGQSPEHHLT